jgi:hypothetical protein
MLKRREGPHELQVPELLTSTSTKLINEISLILCFSQQSQAITTRLATMTAHGENCANMNIKGQEEKDVYKLLKAQCFLYNIYRTG